MIVTPRHARMCGFCSRGIKQHCERYGLDFRKFFREGLPAEQLSAIGNHYMDKLVEAAQREKAGEQQPIDVKKLGCR